MKNGPDDWTRVRRRVSAAGARDCGRARRGRPRAAGAGPGHAGRNRCPIIWRGDSPSARRGVAAACPCSGCGGLLGDPRLPGPQIKRHQAVTQARPVTLIAARRAIFQAGRKSPARAGALRVQAATGVPPDHAGQADAARRGRPGVSHGDAVRVEPLGQVKRSRPSGGGIGLRPVESDQVAGATRAATQAGVGHKGTAIAAELRAGESRQAIMVLTLDWARCSTQVLPPRACGAEPAVKRPGRMNRPGFPLTMRPPRVGTP